jgi:hypothetical protein
MGFPHPDAAFPFGSGLTTGEASSKLRGMDVEGFPLKPERFLP